MSDHPRSTSLIWFITGCSSGLGRALAHAALIRGHRVFATARQPGSLADLAAAFPETCRIHPLDITDFAQIPAAVAAAVAAFQRIDVVVNNAGAGLIGALEEITDQQIAEQFRVNFLGPLAIIRAVLPILRRQRRGHLINLSAAAAIANYPGFSIYGAAKCALEAASESLAAELKPFGVAVTLVQPGPFRTDFVGRSLVHAEPRLDIYEATSGKFRRLLEATNGRQPGDPDKAAEAMVAAALSENPPFRLVLGKYAHDKASRQLTARLAELAAWKPIGLPTDFAPAR